MKINCLLLAITCLAFINVSGQNLYTSSNAASIENEANTTTGWTGSASITSESSTAQNGTYSLRFAVLNTNREARYNFTAVVGTVYNISIWARRTANSNNPAFANWIGLSGFSTTVISSTAWTQYNFVVTATVTAPAIRVYAGPIGAASGVEVFVDAISITVQTPPDTQPPTAPSNLTVSNVTSTSAVINWNASTDNVGVVSYSVREGTTTLGNVGPSITSYQLNNLQPSTSYTYTVVAFDAANNSSQSSPLTFSTLPPPADVTPPTIPTNLTASTITATDLYLSWVPSTDNVAVTGYRIFMNDLLKDSVTSAQYQVVGLTGNTTYTFYVVAYDAAGNVSAPGNQISVTTINPGQVSNYTTENANLPSVDWQSANLYAAGNVGIGTTPNSSYKLSVNGNIRAKEIIVETGWSDFVFEEGYNLASLKEVEDYIKLNGHLKDIPDAEEVQANGIGLARMNKLLLMKIEELTLYVIESNKRIENLQNQVQELSSSPKLVY
ncbi:MAG TPA: fibronectin type III domain-containing protein [Lentimicrobium sp.]|nr:fibronectin type III domain-containing protein [Lentimicrobium sp.]